jgi:hypothetical protein
MEPAAMAQLALELELTGLYHRRRGHLRGYLNAGTRFVPWHGGRGDMGCASAPRLGFRVYEQNGLRAGIGVDAKIGAGTAPAMLSATTNGEAPSYRLAVSYRVGL